MDAYHAATGYVIALGVMSLICFIAYGLDKRQAARGGRRISERTLHTLAFLGGWPGAIAAQRSFRHKTRKLSFRVYFWLVVTLHIGIVGAVVYAYVTSARPHHHNGGVVGGAAEIHQV
jgi:uncharacterized membrane protein YsdA (DUF1294 family)